MIVLLLKENRGTILWVTMLSPGIQPSHQGETMEMITKKKSACGALLTLLVVAGALLGGLQPVRSQSPESEAWRYTWTEPTYGAQPVHYAVEIRRDGLAVEQTRTSGPAPEYEFEAFYGRDYEVRVAGVDELGRQGPFSDWSIRDTCELGIPRR